jgi:HPt (histidine-containing phosphotransfer) domain-containing protein
MPDSCDPEPMLDLALLNELYEAVGEELPTVIEPFLEFVETATAAMEAAHRQQDLPALALEAHSLKGSASNLGASRLAQTCARVEQHARAGDWPGLAEALPGLPEIVSLTSHQLRQLIAARSAGN